MREGTTLFVSHDLATLRLGFVRFLRAMALGMKSGVAVISVGFVLALSALLALAFAPLRGPRGWGYWLETSEDFAQRIWRAKVAEANPTETERFVSEVCGEAVEFQQDDERFQFTVWADQSVVRHFFLRSSFSNVVWVTVASPDYICSARFDVTLKWDNCIYVQEKGDDVVGGGSMRPDDIVCTAGDLRIVKIRLLTRERKRPAAPPGVRPLMLGEPVLGKLAPGTSVRFRVVAPDLGQHVVIDGEPVGPTEPPSSEGAFDRVTFSVEQNGQAVGLAGPPGPRVEGLFPGAVLGRGGGVFDITVRGPERGTGGFCLLVAWNLAIGTTFCADLGLQARLGAGTPVMAIP
ncbi:MAG: hypothetical protein JXP73_07700 [Deltaproteobacteria bacterium]|nr:hypothetical protein [Deltaproteobacteria bacterium]